MYPNCSYCNCTLFHVIREQLQTEFKYYCQTLCFVIKLFPLNVIKITQG